MKRVIKIMLFLVFILSTVSFAEYNEQNHKNRIIMELFSDMTLDRDKTVLSTNDFGANVIVGYLMEEVLKKNNNWNPPVSMKIVNERYNGDELQEKIKSMDDLVSNTKYANQQEKDAMIKKLLDFYRENTVNISGKGVTLTAKDIEELQELYLTRMCFDYEDDIDYGWNAELSDSGDQVCLHYNQYEVVVPLHYEGSGNFIYFEPENAKFCIHEKGKDREPQFEGQRVLAYETLEYITGSVLDMIRHVEDVRFQ